MDPRDNDNAEYVSERVASLPGEMHALVRQLDSANVGGIFGRLDLAAGVLCGRHRLDPVEYVPKLIRLYYEAGY